MDSINAFTENGGKDCSLPPCTLSINQITIHD